MFLYPLFVCSGQGQRREVSSMPGVFQLSVDEVVQEAAAAKSEGVLGVLLFGLPDAKDATGSAAWDDDAPVQAVIRALKREIPELLVVTDVCLCEYTSHGHCGVLIEGEVVNDATVELLARAALSHAAAGADIVAPSDMMDGRVGYRSGSCLTRPNIARRSTGHSARPRIRLPHLAIGAHIKWTRRTSRKPSAKSRSISKKAPISLWSSRR
jgi:delta-aminolevulinic acid dehydratase/porphobilinogen synthase